jgi:hypothetical protein
MSLVLGAGVTGCITADLKAAGEPCFGSSECDVGLTCDFGSDPPVCRTQQTNPGAGPMPDAAIVPDAVPVMMPDAAPGEPPDATPEPPDATPEPPDATPEPPDATPEPPDATPEPPDAAA